ncbi:glutathione peroxidase [Spongiibacter taiwanensis]|uniref:glutathione peroxidase n=1 Tax=Spongiibacter taiwanensis TaxID=1748242 RepID=UPI0020364EFE|nr:glutathione peroxidase [Spongiibacter taiwanensis]USA43082.1 glutathione peroxidase [Spongiibacter taiwanensis]
MIRKLCFFLSLAVPAVAAQADWQCPNSLNTTRPTLEAGELNLCDTVKNAKAVLVVNTASMCGFTPQFEGLEALYQEYKDQGLVVLGVPTADFGGQEYDDAAKTSKVCHANYGVTFPMFRKACIRCDEPDPLLALVSEASGTKPKWNFYKYVLNPATGETESFSSMTKPSSDSLKKSIEGALSGQSTAGQ